MLQNGFDNGVGTIRPPKRIGSAMALVAIILQSSQNAMFGGQGIVNFDTDLVPYVKAEYTWQKQHIIALSGETPTTNELAMRYTDDAVYQACEAFVYNCNTMRSRSGAQVTFSSINFGTDTDTFARMISRNILRAYIAGLGNGENPIFPNLCFRLKSGINLEPGTPNYDLFQLAIECVGKRIQPRFVFADSPAYGGHWEYAASMGCADGNEVVCYVYKGRFYCNSLKRMWEEVDEDIHRYGKGYYIIPANLRIWDGENGFVAVKTIVQNPDTGNWQRITFDNGRSVLVTSDHPFYTENRGRIKDITIGDEVKAYYNFPEVVENEETRDVNTAYILGVLIADGCYSNGNVAATFDSATEQDIISKFRAVVENTWHKETMVTRYRRGDKGNYDMVRINGKPRELGLFLEETFGGIAKINRSIPSFIFTSSRNIQLAFMGGLIDADGYISDKSKVQLGSTNKELALQQLALAQSLGIPAKMYLNHYTSKDNTKIRYRIEFSMISDLVLYISSTKKTEGQWNDKESTTKTPDTVKVTKVEKLGFLNKPSYDVETVSDKFTLSFIRSGNCRTAVRTNVNGDANPDARGNLAFNNISLPYVALEAKEQGRDFTEALDETIEQAIQELRERYKTMCSLKVKDFPFVSQWYQGHEGLQPMDSIEPMIKNGSLSVGFIGLAECLKVICGKHHGKSGWAQRVGLSIVSTIRKATDAATKKYGLNFSTFATPSESACYTLLKAAKERWGVIEGVTDKEYFTNSSHLPVDFKCDIETKIDIEAPYHLLCNAGHIMYIEVASSPLVNREGVEKILQYMAKSGAVYGGINWPHDFCVDCGFQGTFGDDGCPKCGGKHIKRTRIITGYLSTEDRFNPGKVAEMKARVSHGGGDKL